jgi:5-methylcytosine-specific restriction endonuclease McrA
MIQKIKFLLSGLRSVPTRKKRSSKWRALEQKFSEENPLCAACGSHKYLQVHHIKPFHLFPELELDENNLITLCMDKYDCHLKIGHAGNFMCWNPNVIKDAENIRKDFSQFKKIASEAKKNRLK